MKSIQRQIKSLILCIAITGVRSACYYVLTFCASVSVGQDVYGSTPLHLAVYGHAHRMVRVLSQTYRANPLLRTTKGLKAREMCVTHGGGLELEAFLEAAEEAYTF